MFFRVEDVTGKAIYVNFNLVEYISMGNKKDIVLKFPNFAIYITMDSWSRVKDQVTSQIRLQ